MVKELLSNQIDRYMIICIILKFEERKSVTMRGDTRIQVFNCLQRRLLNFHNLSNSYCIIMIVVLLNHQVIQSTGMFELEFIKFKIICLVQGYTSFF